jgi:flavodoxin
MKIAIVHRSFLGTTRRYAEWLQEEVESDLFGASAARQSRMAEYDLVVLCSGTYLGWISIGGRLKRWWKTLRDKKVILLVVGMASPEDPQSERAYLKIPEHIRNDIKYFKVPGKFGSTDREKVRKENLQPVLEYIRELAR